jgi:hypothetical protein
LLALRLQLIAFCLCVIQSALIAKTAGLIDLSAIVIANTGFFV